MEGLKELPQGMPAPGASAQGGEDETKKAQEEQMRRDVMATVLDSAARERRTSNRVFVNCLKCTKSKLPCFEFTYDLIRVCVCVSGHGCMKYHG
jgi:hypothetical protein